MISKTFTKHIRLFFICIAAYTVGHAQKIDSIYFHLYTDSLKKGVHNYINVDAKLDNGRWMPLTDKELLYQSSSGTWSGNNLIIDNAFKGDYVTVTAKLKSNPSLSRSVDIYIKRNPDGPLKSEAEVLKEYKKRN